VNFFLDGVRVAQKFKGKRLKQVLDNVENWQGVTGFVTIEPATGNRVPATLVILDVNAQGELVIDQDWAEAVGAPF
jgi:hypothetical protein